MGIAPSPDAPELLVDKLIGSTYDFVKYVAQHMSIVSLVGRSIDGMDGTEAMLTRRTLELTGSVGALGSVTQFDFPTLFDVTKVLSLNVMLTASDHNRYVNDPRHFYAHIAAGKLVVELKADASATLVNASMKCLVIFEAD